MGLFSDLKAMNDLQQIKHGGVGKLSLSQITCFIVNMPDAKKNLSAKEYDAIYGLYKKLRKCTTKMAMDMKGYTDTAVEIIKMFDRIAPYEKYSGANEIEISFMMNEICSEAEESIPAEMIFDDEDKKYMKYLMDGSSGILDRQGAEKLLMILKCNYDNGKTKALELLDRMALKMIEAEDLNTLAFKLPFMTETLVKNGVISKEEAITLNDKYNDLCMRKMQDKVVSE